MENKLPFGSREMLECGSEIQSKIEGKACCKIVDKQTALRYIEWLHYERNKIRHFVR